MLDGVGGLFHRPAGVHKLLALGHQGGHDQARGAVGALESDHIGRIAQNGVGHLLAGGGVGGVDAHPGDEGRVLQGGHGAIGDLAAQQLLRIIAVAEPQGLGDIGAALEVGAHGAGLFHIGGVGGGALDHRAGEGDRRRRGRGLHDGLGAGGGGGGEGGHGGDRDGGGRTKPNPTRLDDGHGAASPWLQTLRRETGACPDRCDGLSGPRRQQYGGPCLNPLSGLSGPRRPRT